jgi:glycosyltransferase involved in cell wall biosynthesis
VNLVIVHCHFRPGGVRRVIELAVPALVASWRPRLQRVVLLGGEAPDPDWLYTVRQSLPGIRIDCAIDNSAGYLSEQRASPASIARRLHTHLERTLSGLDAADTAVWAHNQGLGRNLLLTRALTEACRSRGLRLVFHHHDWWLDNRWARWPEMRRCGFRTLNAVGRAIFPTGPDIRHAVINQSESSILQRQFGTAAEWIPNPAGHWPKVSNARRRDAAAWLESRLGERAPVWLVPCRLLRRKNLAEALLLTRWLRPEAWLVTTGGVSSPAETAYARTLQDAAQREGWRLKLSVLEGVRSGPSVPELMAASEAVLLTSLQEGFGLPYVEAAAAGRPLIARSLPNVAPDLEAFGFEFPQRYDEVQICLSLLDWPAERARQQRLFRHWKASIPASARARIETPAFLRPGSAPRAVPFSRLTLTGQLEVLRHPPDHSWSQCVPFNPHLVPWRQEAASGRLGVTAWPSRAEESLGDAAYARRLRTLLQASPGLVPPDRAVRCQEDLLRSKLQARFLYPLLWATES